jgi:hypothetical protein
MSITMPELIKRMNPQSPFAGHRDYDLIYVNNKLMEVLQDQTFIGKI